MNSIFSILIIVTTFSNIDTTHKTGVWFEEFATPYTVFEDKGYKVVVASINGGEVPIDPRSMPKTQAEKDKFKSAFAALKTSKKLSGLDLSKFDAVFIPGGHGAMFDLPNDKSVIKAIEAFAANDRLIASVCHGPASLVNIKLPDGSFFVKGKTMTSFTNDEEAHAGLANEMPFLLESRLKENGANFVAKPNWSDHIEISGNLITGQNPQSTASVAKAIVEKLQNK
ncbi:type 1 glutamine amidotransferase domain-containing protein [Campylobacter curvus]|uniref:type 1 glutamine amidotransferase domain-containing protein n=1 Tax=Campylobacter curvus TaxID=200 RepID=UPI00146FCC3E|nr:type 1 glutamine amidotransferase domain-containing protein [Campylobacter curvus]